MTTPSHGPNISPRQQLLSFAAELHAAEDTCRNAVASGSKPEGSTMAFIEYCAGHDVFGGMDRIGLTEDALWRLCSDPKIRSAMISIAPFIDPFRFTVLQAEVVLVLGRFVESDPAVRTFLESIVDGTSMGLLVANTFAVSKAEEKLSRGSNGSRPIPTQDESLAAWVR